MYTEPTVMYRALPVVSHVSQSSSIIDSDKDCTGRLFAINTLRSVQNGRYVADDIVKCISL